jgi:hypothetical protein
MWDDINQISGTKLRSETGLTRVPFAAMALRMLYFTKQPKSEP